MIVIVTCGAKKQDHPARADEMYIGGYHKMCLRYARSLVPPDRIFILSARYGLLRLNDVIEPYSLKMGQPGSVGPYLVKQQAGVKGILNETEVIVLGGELYTNICKQVWKKVSTPLEGLGGFGKQLQWMKGQL